MKARFDADGEFGDVACYDRSCGDQLDQGVPPTLPRNASHSPSATLHHAEEAVAVFNGGDDANEADTDGDASGGRSRSGEGDSGSDAPPHQLPPSRLFQSSLPPR
jgi:hypothetical protein